MTRSILALALALEAAACASAPPAPPKPVGPTYEQKMAWILRLEDQRMLRDPAPPAPAPPPAPPTGRREKTPPPPAPPPPPDLTRLVNDEEARVRRRAALAIGHVGLKEGSPALVALLADGDAEVRQMAAFALGLLGDASAREPLAAALNDPSPLVQGSAAEALGLLGDASAAPAIAAMMSRVVQSGALAQTPGDDMDARRDTPAAAFRLGAYALVRLKAADQLIATVLDSGGQPRVRWWPVAYALQRLEDRRGLAALLTFAKDSNPYARAFAVKGLGALKDRSAVPALMNLLTSGERPVLIETIRALGRIGDPAAAPPLLKFVTEPNVNPQVRLEAVSALGGLKSSAATDTLLDLLGDSTPAIRAAALRSLAALDPENFVTVLSGLDDDPQWTVRAALAAVLGTLTPQAGLPRLNAMLNDQDQRVVPSVLASMVTLRDPKILDILLAKLKADDPVVRAAAAAGIGELKPPVGVDALTAAYLAAERDAGNTARAAILAAVAKYGAAAAAPVLRSAFKDKDWSVRVRAAMLLKQLDPSATDADAQIRPAPTTLPPDIYSADRILNPQVSPQVYIDTDRGSIQIELAVIDAPLTVENFVRLVQKGFFNGLAIHRVVPDFVVQDGDPRGDGEGGPGYTIRDELNELPYLRGTVGMALDPWPDSGGSQFFITYSPQPHLDARYTVFGRVVAGMDVADQIQQGDIIRRIRVWDGQTMTERND
jgi:HEAT repeat protein/cyclophilin family peptidyl-prolyl cis-trans isomerase